MLTFDIRLPVPKDGTIITDDTLMEYFEALPETTPEPIVVAGSLNGREVTRNVSIAPRETLISRIMGARHEIEAELGIN